MNDNNLSCLPELCLRVWQRDASVPVCVQRTGRLAEIQRLAISQGLWATVRGDQVSIRGKVGTAITLGFDPLTAFVALAFGFVGARWAADPAVSELFDDTKKRWKQAAKAARGR